MNKILIGAALAVVACKKGGGGGDCADAIGPSIDKMTAAGAKRMEAAPPELKAKMDEAASKLKVAIINRCTTDKWSSEVVDCYKKSEKREDLAACRTKLPEDQATALRKDEMAVMASVGVGRGMMGGHGPGGPGGPGGPAPAGSGDVTGTPPPAPPAGGPADGSAAGSAVK